MLQVLKTKYASGVLRDSIEQIQSEQRQVVEDYGLFKTRRLYNSIRGHYVIRSEDEDIKLTVRLLKYARFLDMKSMHRAKENVEYAPGDNRRTRQGKLRMEYLSTRKKMSARHEGYHLYNKVVFGILYHRTLPALKFGFTDDIRETMQRLLEAAGPGGEKAAEAAAIKMFRNDFAY